MTLTSGLENARPFGDSHPDDGIVSHSPALRDALDRMQRVAPIDTTVLLTGETGTGKELMARALHRRSSRQTRPMVTVNLAAIPEPLVASELFGHEAGAFTGASQRRMGRFEIADHGTLFLDEVGELSPDMQVALLRIVQEGEFERLGASQTRRVDVRLIAATNRDLRTEVLAGRFREDLFYRLSSIQIRIPSLKERLEDIPLLVQFFLKKYNDAYGKKISGLTRRAQAVLLQHPWPGNVRELENVISSASITANGDFIDLPDLPEGLQQRPRNAEGEEWRPLSLEEVRKVHIRRVLDMCQGNRLRAAQVLGIGRTSLYRYLKHDAPAIPARAKSRTA